MTFFKSRSGPTEAREQFSRRLADIDALCESVRNSDPRETRERLRRLRYGHPAASSRA